MKRIAQFERVSKEQFQADFINTFGETNKEAISECYDKIMIPKRATKGSAGYDFITPVAIELKPGESMKIPTGIRSRIEEGWVLQIFPRSGLGFKYRLQLDNTVGIIDSDYYESDNEGHIFIRITNDNREGKILSLPAGSGFAQGIFLEFGITEDDEASADRNGGFGSTGV